MCYRVALLLISVFSLLRYGSLTSVSIKHTGIVNIADYNSRNVWFVDNPPNDYFERKTMRDCPARFYPIRSDPIHSIGSNTVYSVMGGIRVFDGEFSHMAAIGWIRANGTIDYLCGGSLITKRHILTAAHCTFDSENVAPDTVRLGDTDLGSQVYNLFAQQIAIRGITVHPQYRGSRHYFDIALIELAKPSEDNYGVCLACLWREAELPDEQMEAIGFGATGFGEERSPTLQAVKLNKITPLECAERLFPNRRRMPEGFRNDQFCATGDGMDSCEGDSGGPIGVKRLDVRGVEVDLVAGIVSFGTPCAPGSIGVYTRISDYIDWIERETNQSLSYEVCTRNSMCPGREKYVLGKFDDNYSRYRFGLIWNETDPSVYECGATLIDYQFLLTSAHCVTTAKGHPQYVAYEQKSERVADVYVSPRYKAGISENDIALIKMEKFINDWILRPVCLWDRRIDGEWPKVTDFPAYGSIKNRNSSITVPASNGRKCSTNDASESDLICFDSNVKFIPNVCSIHHGAMVIQKPGRGKPIYASGVTSTLSKGCNSKLVVTDVTPHIDWIESIVIARRDQVLIFSD